MATKTKTETAVTLKPMKIREVVFRLVGKTPLLVHAFSQKMKDRIAENQANPGTTDRKKEARDPQAEYEAAFYRDVNGKACIPSVGVKNCIVNAAQRFYKGVTKVGLNGALWIGGDTVMADGALAVLIAHEKVEMAQHTVRLGGMDRSVDLRYRPMFTGWSLSVPMEYDESYVSATNLVEYVRRAGRSVGLCEWRPEKGGDYGMFEMAGKE